MARSIPRSLRIGAIVVVVCVATAFIEFCSATDVNGAAPRSHARTETRPPPSAAPVAGRPRDRDLDTSGYDAVWTGVAPWARDATLAQISESWQRTSPRLLESIEQALATGAQSDHGTVKALLAKAAVLNYQGAPWKAYEALVQARSVAGTHATLAGDWHYTIVYFQGVTALRGGESDNCVMCRGASSCILPIAPSALHSKPKGSRLAIEHFTEYLRAHPDDLQVKWLLNIAHMTLGEHPSGVDPRFLVSLDRFRQSESGIGEFRDVGHAAGLDRFNQAGGSIMEDFDGDGLLDIVVSTVDPTERMAYYRNNGDGTFEDHTEASYLTRQLGGINCVQTDYNNDGDMDIFISRGAWLALPMRPTLLRNDGSGVFMDVTEAAGLLDPVNSISSSWADYDNDGRLDVFICCERQRNRLYRNKGAGTFEEVAVKAGVQGRGATCKGAAWIDYDRDDFPDLFVNNLGGSGQLFRNCGDGTFAEVTLSLGIDGPVGGFSCWAWDYDNDGWQDIFATCYDRSVEDVVRGLVGQPHSRHSNKLFRNLAGRQFVDVTREAGLDMVFATMGSNFADFDNDGFLDMYLGTGDPHLSTLVPNRMFRNVGGRRFAEITASSGTGHLQKGHGVACGDWDCDGDVDLFVEMGGATNGDRYHNVLFENPGQGHHWLTVKLVGSRTNRAAIGARIKVVTAGPDPRTVYRHVTSGSSFGANPLQQTLGLAGADRVALLEVHWPTSGTTQVFHDVAADQSIRVTEFATQYETVTRAPIAQPK